MKTDGRVDGLNNQGYPLRKIIERKDGLHFLECGHSLPPVSDASVRWRRCPVCVGQPLGGKYSARFRSNMIPGNNILLNKYFLKFRTVKSSEPGVDIDVIDEKGQVIAEVSPGWFYVDIPFGEPGEVKRQIVVSVADYLSKCHFYKDYREMTDAERAITQDLKNSGLLPPTERF